MSLFYPTLYSVICAILLFINEYILVLADSNHFHQRRYQRFVKCSNYLILYGSRFFCFSLESFWSLIILRSSFLLLLYWVSCSFHFEVAMLFLVYYIFFSSVCCFWCLYAMLFVRSRFKFLRTYTISVPILLSIIPLFWFLIVALLLSMKCLFWFCMIR